ADWDAAARLARERRVILAGGLTPDNVTQAIEKVRPFGIDVSSGVESSPGIKDEKKMKDLFDALAPARARRDPDARAYFGEFGGGFVPETLVEPIEALERAYFDARGDASFMARLDDLLRHYAGRPTPLYEARRLTEAFGGARVFLKREDLTHTGAHKINNALG